MPGADVLFSISFNLQEGEDPSSDIFTTVNCLANILRYLRSRKIDFC